MSITGDEMAARIITELVNRGRLHHADASDVDHDRRVVARILKECLRDAWRRSISPGPIAAALDEIDLEQRKTDPAYAVPAGDWSDYAPACRCGRCTTCVAREPEP